MLRSRVQNLDGVGKKAQMCKFFAKSTVTFWILDKVKDIV